MLGCKGSDDGYRYDKYNEYFEYKGIDDEVTGKVCATDILQYAFSAQININLSIGLTVYVN